ncbi:hypothetical protein S40285_00196 [Stachybotrys chlorohalonatus IBT 40285]|uniref:Protein bimA n=1 Tax=Stachybotrys chlorohalonatus (strain IBT 40285) TaxID=1283841 RepID=A0A084QTV6_STAC4|nr:hypothetical protein S40285_00196 [Stachybotrys chlorohalonata IBT 40285]
MAPTPTAVGGLLQQVIHQHLDNSCYDNALFFAERYVAQDPKSSDAIYLHALCYLRLGNVRAAHDVSKVMGYRATHIGCTWVFAQACLVLEKYKDGISALEKSRVQSIHKSTLGKHSATSRASYPDLAAVLCLLGKLHRGSGSRHQATAFFEEALKMNPFMWDAFQALCDMGVNVRVPNIFKTSETLVQAFSQETNPSGAEPRDGNAANSLDPTSKKHYSRTAPVDMGGDPFSANYSSADIEVAKDEMVGEAAVDDLMSKVQAARLRLATSTNSQISMDGMETPPNASVVDAAAVRAAQSHEPPQAPARKPRSHPAIESSLEAPPRMNYKFATRRNGRPLEKTNQEQPLEQTAEAPPSTTTGAMRSSIPAAERKRTVSGHPVARPTTSEEAGMRRSARLNMFKPSAKANMGAANLGPAAAGRELKKARPQITRIIRPGSSGSNVGRVVSGNRKPLEDAGADVDQGEQSRVKDTSSGPPHTNHVRPMESDTAKLEEALKWMLDVCKKLGGGYYLLSQFQCHEALQSLSTLPSTQQSSPWVLAQMGRAHYELAAYAEAEKFYRRLRVVAPYRLDGMEVYSTVLWHLKRETDLSFLAHELVDAAWHSPQAWCALGNAWSLVRDHEQALRCFKRATQLDPSFAYAFTLQGHEHVANEEYDKALTVYRQAVTADPRHYNAYYGIGRVQERQGSYEKAFVHFHAARGINPNNAVLICCIGNVFERQKQMVPALHAYSKAVELAPRAAQTRYKKARALLAVGQIEAAQKELMVLKDLAPDESTVHFLLGSLYKTMNEKQLAVRHYTIALALDPKSGPKVKEAIESIEGDVAMDDSIM